MAAVPPTSPDDWERRLQEVAAPDGLASRLRQVRRDEESLDRRLQAVPVPAGFVASLRRIPFGARRRTAATWSSYLSVASLLLAVCSSYFSGFFFFLLASNPMLPPVHTPLDDFGRRLMALRAETPAASPDASESAAGAGGRDDGRSPLSGEGPSALELWAEQRRDSPFGDPGQDWEPLFEAGGREENPWWKAADRPLAGRVDLHTALDGAGASGRPAHKPHLARIVGNVGAGQQGAVATAVPDWGRTSATPPRLDAGFDLGFQVRYQVHPIVPLAHPNSALRETPAPLTTGSQSFLVAEHLFSQKSAGGAAGKAAAELERFPLRIEDFVAFQAAGQASNLSDAAQFTLSASESPQRFAWMTHLLQASVRGPALPPASAGGRKWIVLLEHSDAMRADGRFLAVREALEQWRRRLPVDDRLTILAAAAAGPRVLVDGLGGGSTPAGGVDPLRTALAVWRPEGVGDWSAGAERSGALARAAGKNARVVWMAAQAPAADAASTEWRAAREQLAKARTPLKIVELCGPAADEDSVAWAKYAEGTALEFATAGQSAELLRRLSASEGAPLRPTLSGVRVVIELNPLWVDAYRLVGHEASQVVSADASSAEVSVFPGESAATLVELRLKAWPTVRASMRNASDPREFAWAARMRWSGWDPVARKSVSDAATLAPDELQRRWSEADPLLQRTAVAAAVAERLRGTVYSRGASWAWLRETAASARKEARDEPAFQRLAALLQRLEEGRAGDPRAGVDGAKASVKRDATW